MDGGDLLGHHRQHLNVNAVELIKAGPGPSAGQPLEELAHSHEVQLVRTVEHHTLDGHSLGQVLGGLCLARPGRTSRGPTKFEVEGTG